MNFDNDIALVGYCPICKQGRQFVSREVSTGKLLVSCEDCESEWGTPSDAGAADLALSEHYGQQEYVTIGELRNHQRYALVLNRD